MINKKSQMQITETIIVLFIFFILFILGFVFYTKVFMKSAGETIREQRELKAVQIAQMISDMPELQCTKNGEIIPNCVDKWKLDVVSTNYWKKGTALPEVGGKIIYDKRNYYSDIFGGSKIDISQVYPEGETDDTLVWNISHLPSRSKKKTMINLPVIIYDPTAEDVFCEIIGRGSCNFGWVNVTSYD